MAVETSGRLKVIIIQGRDLVIRDFKTSDPYVVVKLGKQKARTKVISSNLNPVWNEELNFTMDTKHSAVLKFEMFDKDLFKRDDKMGRATFNLQPMQSASRLSKILGISGGETTLRKVVPGMDDCFQEEYSIRCVDGEVVQDVWLRLTGVESGEIQVRIIYVEDESVGSWATNCKREFC
ncbi:protein C2-DOMAIN ABA-RELATED 11-like [Cucurbita moschata]|uniref:Protein C2-DOMAIN ABA-RELATED 11-like n=1 Tax=Cucurbita moschata TaxID=3662 RepID=A0A6J1EBV2_CUCMO|nr:protein C2-DOMAIN ABA-RELATED 11-like [Cucurbita moschata]